MNKNRQNYMNFFKTFLAALLAFVVANILLMIFSVLIFAGMLSAFQPAAVHVPGNSVLRIDFTNGVTDAPDPAPFVNGGLFGGLAINQSNSLLQVIGAIENASYDPNIKGIYINVTGGSISMANVEEVRMALQRFREGSGKFIVAYAEGYSQLGYYLSSVADKVLIHPEGSFSWQGLSSQVMFYKGLLDKLGVEVEIFRHGTFKSAVEPFMQEGMSRENRMQLSTVMGSLWETLRQDIGASRGIAPEVLSDYAKVLAVDTPHKALQLGLVDAVLYEDQVMELLERLASGASATAGYELDRLLSEDPDAARLQQANAFYPQEDLLEEATAAQTDSLTDSGRAAVAARRVGTLVELPDYISTLTLYGGGLRGDQIAIVYIDGSIVDGPGAPGSVGGADVAAKLAMVRDNERVKGVVVRVNSPGGSALASDIMWREIELLRREKPVIVSMGGYAASGGYYVSCPADMILADRTTITGSIGVFGLMPVLDKALKDKAGITVDVVGTEPHADMGSPFRPMDRAERDYMQSSVERVYSTFVGHVAAGRNMSVQAVDEIGGGRIWSGANAIGIGLVDGIGGLSDAIALCADRAGVAGSYRVKEIVDEPDALTMLVRSMLSAKSPAVRGELEEAFVHYKNLKNLLEEGGVQARMPFEMEIR